MPYWEGPICSKVIVAPVGLEEKNDGISMLVTAVGQVQFGLRASTGFHYTFFLERDPSKNQKNAYYILSLVFRRIKV